jgi:hypothetical protein
MKSPHRHKTKDLIIKRVKRFHTVFPALKHFSQGSFAADFHTLPALALSARSNLPESRSGGHARCRLNLHAQLAEFLNGLPDAIAVVR